MNLNEIDIVHHFGGGMYAKETKIPAGHILTQHAHDFDHLSILAKGNVMLSMDDVGISLTGPVCVNIPAGKTHSVAAAEDSVWFCIWPENASDLGTSLFLKREA